MTKSIFFYFRLTNIIVHFHMFTPQCVRYRMWCSVQSLYSKNLARAKVILFMFLFVCLESSFYLFRSQHLLSRWVIIINVQSRWKINIHVQLSCLCISASSAYFSLNLIISSLFLNTSQRVLKCHKMISLYWNEIIQNCKLVAFKRHSFVDSLKQI